MENPSFIILEQWISMRHPLGGKLYLDFFDWIKEKEICWFKADYNYFFLITDLEQIEKWFTKHGVTKDDRRK